MVVFGAVAPSLRWGRHLLLRWPRSLPWPRYSLPGSALALLFGCASFTPSLVPREWFVQGIVAGLTSTFGYAIGVFLAWALRPLLRGRRPSAALTRGLWLALAGLGLPLLVATLVAGGRWQHQIHLLTGREPPASSSWIPTLLLALGILLVFVGLARALRWLEHEVRGWLVRLVPGRVADPLAILIVVLLLLGLNDGLLSREAGRVANSTFASMNAATSLGTLQPTAAERSGSPASLVPWDTLGRQGRDFVGRGPNVEDLTAFSGIPAQEPVRVYVGLRSAATGRARAELAVRELRRTGGFDRAVLVVATTTGTGLVDSSAADSIEYMYNGDTAIVADQFSYLPSWLSFLGDRRVAERAGRQLFDTVYAAWAAMPPGHRPRLLVTATSLGVYGSEAAFTGLADILERTDGVVWAGAPNFSRLHHEFVQGRDQGSPEWHPVYQSGRSVRFAATPADLRTPGTRWPRPRVVYLQHGSDPVVFWGPRLAFSKPDWLSGPRAPDVSPNMFWLPVVTFWQVTADLPSAFEVPPGHGHRYRELYVDAWAAVAAPKGWTSADSRRLRDVISKTTPPPEQPPW